jgi:hypothetical protein
MSKLLKEDVVIPAELSQQYLVVKKQIADKQTQRDLLMKQVNQKENEINILTKNLIAIESKATQLQGKAAEVKAGKTTSAGNTTPSVQGATTPQTPQANESFKILDLLAELNEMDKDWLLEEFEEEEDWEQEEREQERATINDEEEWIANDENENPDYIFALRVIDDSEPEDIIAKVYRNEISEDEDGFWKIRVVQGSEDPLETMQFDPDMEFLDILEKIGEMYDEVEEIPMEEYQDLLDDKEKEDSKFYEDDMSEE